ncbi:MAG: hypothetical protein V1899_06415 [Planctomycetota bacterium]
MILKVGHLSCAETREFLSDVIDARRGEIPPPDATRLSESGMRATVELHLAGCVACRRELEAMEDIGAIYADFAVDEKSAQSFADYGQIVRVRMAGEQSKVISHPERRIFRRWGFWAAFAASGLVAASLTMLIRPIFHNTINRDTKIAMFDNSAVAVSNAHEEKRPRKTIAQDPLAPIIYNYSTQDGVQTASLHDPSDPTEMKRVQQHEGCFGYLLFHEPLLGVFLKTTRSADRAVNEGTPGLMVERVASGSPAQLMGLRKNDCIATLNYNVDGKWREIRIANGSTEEAIKFLANVKKLGAGVPIMLHIIRPVATEFLFMRPVSGTLGEYEIAP